MTQRNLREGVEGFTLVELLVVMALFSILVTVGTDIFSPMIRAYNKASIQSEINHNGRYVLSLMEQQIRNAKRIVSLSADSIQIEDYDNNLVTFSRAADEAGCPPGKSNGFLRLTRLGQNPVENVALTNIDRRKGVSVLSFTVVRSDPPGSPPVVSFEVLLAQACNASATVDYQAAASFSTTVALRSY